MKLRTIIKNNLREQLENSKWNADYGTVCTSCFSDVLNTAGGYNNENVIEDIKKIMTPNNTIEGLAEDMTNIITNYESEKGQLTTIGLLTCISTEECSSFIPHLKNDLISMANQNPEKEFKV